MYHTTTIKDPTTKPTIVMRDLNAKFKKEIEETEDKLSNYGTEEEM